MKKIKLKAKNRLYKTTDNHIAHELIRELFLQYGLNNIQSASLVCQVMCLISSYFQMKPKSKQ